MRKLFLSIVLYVCAVISSQAADQFVLFAPQGDAFCLTGQKGAIVYDQNDWKGVHIAIANLKKDLEKVTGRQDYPIVIGTLGKSDVIDKMAKKKQINAKELQGKTEKFIITTVKDQLVIAGSDKRGTIYGIYELSQQIGVSPWYDWADVPAEKHEQLYIKKGIFTDGEPAVRYRGIFLNDEAPCLTGWVKENYGGYNHEFYARVFELVLRLKGNYMWPAMWDAAFYADDPLNMQTADDMGVCMGTSHHEPLARAHKEWTSHRREYGAWNYDTNQETLDKFWKGGVERMKNTEDVVTIGMRGDGDEAMGDHADVALLERIVTNQRKLIEEATGKPAKETPQMWALYKEVQEYYEKGMNVPDDVILLLCDDNWGNVRVLPEQEWNKGTGAFSKRHPGGYGMYYHVDYVGAPRNSKFQNISQIQRMWEQLQLTYTYGVDKLWILNVGDLKPMEFPIDFWFKMAWNPSQFNPSNLMEYTESFCRQQFGEKCAKEAARILNLQCKYAHRRTPEQLDTRTFNLQTGEWKEYVEKYDKLERDATILRELIPVPNRQTYNELIYHPVRVFCNLYNMYYAVAMNGYYAQKNDPRANEWADKVELCFRRAAELCDEYNHKIAGGKWNHMMDEIYIGYRSWNNPRQNTMPQVKRVEDADAVNGEELVIVPRMRIAIIEADEFVRKTDAKKGSDGAATWQVVPDLGIWKAGVALFPYTKSTEGASITYEFNASEAKEKAVANIILATNFPFNDGRGQRLAVLLDDKELQTLNVNEASRYVVQMSHDQNFEWETTRMNQQKITIPSLSQGKHQLTLCPLDPGIVIERIVVE
ncbi:MAG: glycosyl hydrolase 115 family protein [Bacteroidaceae bacterium]|nr:glycosyl hydrolase 115 family protein [Bacteroidaceae bacterium]